MTPPYLEKRGLLAAALVFVLACAISWGIWYGVAPDTDDRSLDALLGNPALLAMKFGPSLAGLAVALMLGGAAGIADLGARIFDFHKRVIPSLGALAYAALVTLPAGALFIALFLPDAEIPGLSIAMLAPLAGWIALRTLLGGGLGEELGWRGVALPALMHRMGPRWASLWLGIAWTVWHAPVFFESETPWWILAIVQTALTVPLSFVFTWFYLRSGGSLFVAMLLHGALNGFNAFAEFAWAPVLDEAGVWALLRIGVILATGVAACVFMTPRRG